MQLRVLVIVLRAPLPDILKKTGNFLVVISRGKHLFPFRTEQLSPDEPMVLPPQGGGRVGRCQVNNSSP